MSCSQRFSEMDLFGRIGAASSMRTVCTWVIVLMNLAALAVVVFLAFDVGLYSTSDFGRRFSIDLLIASTGAMTLTTLPGLLLVRRWSLPSVALATAYPAAWVGIILAL
jgi:hypothetical protein